MKSDIIPGTEPFYFDGNEIGCLLVHGFTSTPREVRWMGEYLAEKGFTVSGILLAGHGTSMEDMIETTWRDWFDSVLQGYEELVSRGKKVFALGSSMGGALVLHLAAHRPVAGVVGMSTPLKLTSPWMSFLPLIKHFVKYMPKGKGTWVNPEVEKWHISYTHYPTASIMELVKFLSHYRDDLPDVTAPVLLMQSKTDNLVLPENMELLKHRLSSAPVETFWVERSDHVITEDAEREKVFRRAEEFIRAHSQEVGMK